MERVILHSDANSFYASVEILYNPYLRGKPVAVCGDPEARHGIVLTKSQEAKKYGIKTAEPIWQAKRKCPNLIIVPPDYPLYVEFAQLMRDIYQDYTDRIEQFGLDENWLDISAPGLTVEKGEMIANEIRRRIRDEVGITVSVGVSFNKIFSKLGSDMRKPDATTVITRENFKTKVWPLPVSDLLYVGPKTTEKLARYNIHTIGDLARADDDLLRYRLGVNGRMLKAFALGQDMAPVMPVEASAPIKSIGNSTTTPRDIETMDDARCVFYLLCECVAKRLREHGLRSKCIGIYVRGTDMASFNAQQTIDYATNLTPEITSAVLNLFTRKCEGRLPVRNVGVSCSSLVPETHPEQMDLFGNIERREKFMRLEKEVDEIRRRFGYQVIQRGVVLADRGLSCINPNNHIQPAAPFYTGA